MSSNTADTELLLFPTVDSELLQSTLSAPPFVIVEGIFNIRDFGAGYATSLGDARVKPLFLFRSGEPSGITPKGIEQFKSYGIKKVFDLRADVEIRKYNTVMPQIEGVEIVRSLISEEALDPVEIADQLKEFSEDEAVIMQLLGVSDEDIVHDYVLTRIGLQPAFPLLALRFQKEDVFRKNWKGVISLGTANSHNHLQHAILTALHRSHTPSIPPNRIQSSFMSSNASEAVWKGDFTGDLKERIIRFSDILTYAEGFAHSASSQLKLKEVAIFKRDQDGKTQCKVTYETTVDESAYCLSLGVCLAKFFRY
ncbi:hypothetical protein BD310DRAFT_830224 [Dichomitus squalens]|uniref:Uncharacterized protein n=1 Tax=Dichomitus squalens TaxID=114155 RepID=A0A4Q9PHW3_9APHY|nr:hypothetical protein BD310DRAFT_830224 [Dichomitus squalens]